MQLRGGAAHPREGLPNCHQRCTIEVPLTPKLCPRTSVHGARPMLDSAGGHITQLLGDVTAHLLLGTRSHCRPRPGMVPSSMQSSDTTTEPETRFFRLAGAYMAWPGTLHGHGGMFGVPLGKSRTSHQAACHQWSDIPCPQRWSPGRATTAERLASYQGSLSRP